MWPLHSTSCWSTLPNLCNIKYKNIQNIESGMFVSKNDKNEISLVYLLTYYWVRTLLEGQLV